MSNIVKLISLLIIMSSAIAPTSAQVSYAENIPSEIRLKRVCNDNFIQSNWYEASVDDSIHGKRYRLIYFNVDDNELSSNKTINNNFLNRVIFYNDTCYFEFNSFIRATLLTGEPLLVPEISHFEFNDEIFINYFFPEEIIYLTDIIFEPCFTNYQINLQDCLHREYYGNTSVVSIKFQADDISQRLEIIFIRGKPFYQSIEIEFN